MPRKPPVTPRPVSADDVDPRHRWDRPLQAPGHTQVDFEERVDFKRLHAYRLGRARQSCREVAGSRADVGDDGAAPQAQHPQHAIGPLPARARCGELAPHETPQVRRVAVPAARRHQRFSGATAR